MSSNRRHVLALAAAAGMLAVTRGRAAVPTPALDSARFGLSPGSADDQSRALQRAIDESARQRQPLMLAAGTYRAGGLQLPAGAQVFGVRGATRLIFVAGQSLLSAENADHVTLSGIVFDGAKRALPQGSALLQCVKTGALRITQCEIANAGGTALHLTDVSGEVSDTLVTDAGDAAIHSDNAHGLLIARNIIAGVGNNGIQVWRSDAGDDGTIVTDNRISGIQNRSGGSGQYGNAINIFRAGNVIVRANRISDCAFSAVRGNAASNLHIDGNAVSAVREVALYSEFGFEGVAITGNVVDGAAMGISVTNFNQGGRLAVVQGNIIRNLYPKRPAGTDPGDSGGVGIGVEADAAISGNVVENAPTAGIVLGFGTYLRDIAATGNVVRKAGIGIGVSVAAGAGTALIADNLIAETMHGAIVGMDRNRIVTADLAKGGAERFPTLTIVNNRVR